MVAAISDPMDEEEMPKGALCCWIPDSQIGACGCDKSVSPGLCSRLICAECVYVNYVGLTVCGVLMLILFDMAVLGLFCNRIYVVCCWSPKLWGTHYHRKMIAVGAPMMAHPAAAPVVVQQQQQHLYRTITGLLSRRSASGTGVRVQYQLNLSSLLRSTSTKHCPTCEGKSSTGGGKSKEIKEHEVVLLDRRTSFINSARRRRGKKNTRK